MSEASESDQFDLVIKNKSYHVERIVFDGEVQAKGWKLTHFDDKLNHGPYNVIQQPSGRITCECADFMLVGQREQRPCKHINKLVEIGLFQ